MLSLSGCLSAFLRFCAGFPIGAVAAMIGWQIIHPPGGPNYGDGIGYGFAMMFWMFIGGVVCSVIAISPVINAFSQKLSENEEPDFKLNILCFALPLLLGLLPAFLVQDGEGLLGLIVCFLWALLASGALLLRPNRKIKRAIWMYIFGFTVTIAFFFVGAYINLSSQPSHL